MDTELEGQNSAPSKNAKALPAIIPPQDQALVIATVKTDIFDDLFRAGSESVSRINANRLTIRFYFA
ncbi:MAG TPA: hypothetical protein VNI36_09140 [Candidatus Dormibacteraeota bacterium]|nr:hypothetical protein [Candidatus Dormibacteraeota bacterium]